MNELIYFPYFEPENEDWLKFSLLTLDQFRPIIPKGKESKVSDTFKLIQDKTDLINPYTNLYEVGYQATKNTQKEILEIHNNYKVHKLSYNFRSFEDVFENKLKMNYLIYNDKFHHDFIEFCKKRNLAIETEEGLIVSPELGNIFMKNLAKQICNNSDKESSLITDSKKFHKYLNLNEHISENTLKKMSYIQSRIELAIPDIRMISYKDLIKFRKNLEVERQAFNVMINEANLKNLTDEKFIKELNKIKKVQIAGYTALGLSILLVPFTIQSCIESSGFGKNEIISLISNIAGIAGVDFGMKQISQEKIAAQKYFVNLKKLYQNK